LVVAYFLGHPVDIGEGFGVTPATVFFSAVYEFDVGLRAVIVL